MRRPLLALAAAFLLVPSLAAAQVYAPNRFEITPTAGWRTGGELSASDNELFDVDVEVDESDVLGLKVDIPLGGRGLQLELLAARQESAFTADPGLFGEDDELADVDITYYQAGILWQWGGGQVNPFVALAAGIARIDPDVSGVDAEERFSGSIAGGVKVFFAPHVGLRLEGRGYWTAIDEKFDDNDRCCRDYRYDDDLYQVEATAGLIVAF